MGIQKVWLRVTGKVGDTSADPDKFPDRVLVTGKAFLKPNVKEKYAEKVEGPDGYPELSIPAGVAVTITDGYLTYNGDQFIWLDVSETGWNWNISFSELRVAGESKSIAAFNFDLEEATASQIANAALDPSDPLYYRGTNLADLMQFTDPETGSPAVQGPRGYYPNDVAVVDHKLVFTLNDPVSTQLETGVLIELEQAALDAASALASKNAAATSETNAAASAASALASKNAASTSEINAASSASSALASKNAASTSEANAATSASDALAYRNTASTHATNAGTANTNAQSAKTAAETANTNAQSAKTAAETANTNAQSAKTAAETAKTASETARNAAQSAQAAAEAARDAAVGGVVPDNGVSTIKVVDGAITSAKIADNTIVNADINASAAIATSKIAGLDTALSNLAPKSAPALTGAATLDGQAIVKTNDSRLSDARVPAAGTVQADFFWINTAGTRKVGLGDKAAGIPVMRAFIIDSVTYQFDTADTSGSCTLSIQKNGTNVVGAQLSVTAANQADGTATDAARTATLTDASRSFAVGDRFALNISALGGGTVGKGASVWVKARWV